MAKSIDYKIILTSPTGTIGELECDNIELTTIFSVADISDISLRKDRITKNITFKGTANNNQIFGNVYNSNRVTDTSNAESLFFNYNPNKETDCYIYEDGTLLYKGSLRVSSIDIDKLGNIVYSAVITGMLINFFRKIEGKELTDVTGFAALTHTYNVPTIKNSWELSAITQGYIYPSIDYGSGVVFKKDTSDIRNFRTGIYLKTYFDTIFKEYGYSYKSDFINSDVFKRAYIPYSEKDFNQTITGTLFSTAGNTQSIPFSVPDSTSMQTKPITVGSPTSTNYVTVATETVDGNSSTTFKFPKKITTDGTLNLSFNMTVSGSANLDIAIYPVLAGTINYNALAKKSYVINNTAVSDSLTLQIPFKEYPVDTKFTIVASFMSNNTLAASGTLFITSTNFKIGNTNLISSYEVALNDVVSLSQVVPRSIKIKDFLKSILQFFNLYIISDPDNPVGFIIEPYNNFYSQFSNPKLSAVTWTDKIDLSKNINIVTNSNLSKKYNYKFKEDTDYYNALYKTKYNDTYGNYSITDSTGFSEEKNIEVSFSPTVIVNEAPDDKIIPMLYKGTPTAKEVFKTNLRMLYNNGSATCNPYMIGVITSGTTTTVYNSGVTTYNASHHILYTGTTAVSNLQFGVPKEVFAPVNQSIFTLPTLYSNYYQLQLNDLINPNLQIYTVDAWLNELDIANLDFRKPIFIDSKYGHSYFKLLEVTYSNKNEISLVKLQRVIL